MRIGMLAARLGTTPETVRFYERQGLLPAPPRGQNGYREYTGAGAERLRLLLGLRRLDLPLEQAAALAELCSGGQCREVSAQLREAAEGKRRELRRRIDELRYLDRRLGELESALAAGASPGPLITRGKEEAS